MSIPPTNFLVNEKIRTKNAAVSLMLVEADQELVRGIEFHIIVHQDKEPHTFHNMDVPST